MLFKALFPGIIQKHNSKNSSYDLYARRGTSKYEKLQTLGDILKIQFLE